MEKKQNRFSRVLIVILTVFIAVLIISSFILGESKYSLTNEMILLILLLIVLSLAEIFDNFSIGNLFMAKKEKHEKEVELKEVKQENKELRTQLISIVSNSVTNQNMNVFGLSKDGLMQMAGIEQAESSAVEEKQAEDSVIDNKRLAEEFRKRYRILPQIEKLALDRFCTQFKIPILSIVRDIQFSKEFIGIDPIMEQNVIFDAYYKSLQEEVFIEVRINFIPDFRAIYSLYYLLSKIYYYGKANQLHTKMVLIVANLPESYWNNKGYPGISKVIFKLQETFAPAIKNSLLEIVPIEITPRDLDKIMKEFETQEGCNQSA